MTKVRITIEENLLARVDRAARALRTSRSEFTRDALRQALAEIEFRGAEERQRRGYEYKPVKPGEFDSWETEQVWND